MKLVANGSRPRIWMRSRDVRAKLLAGTPATSTPPVHVRYVNGVYRRGRDGFATGASVPELVHVTKP